MAEYLDLTIVDFLKERISKENISKENIIKDLQLSPDGCYYKFDGLKKSVYSKLENEYKLKAEIYYLDETHKIKHRNIKPAYIGYYPNGNVEFKKWYSNGQLCRNWNPVIKYYYESGQLREEEWNYSMCIMRRVKYHENGFISKINYFEKIQRKNNDPDKFSILMESKYNDKGIIKFKYIAKRKFSDKKYCKYITEYYDEFGKLEKKTTEKENKRRKIITYI